MPDKNGTSAPGGHDIIVVGASAGGVEALIALARDLPRDLPAAVFVVLHVPAHGMSVLPSILSRSGPLPAAHARDGEAIEAGRIYVAPPDHHLLIKPGQVRVMRGPSENGHRPAIDPMFRTAARAYGRRVIGVILTGTLDDGTSGLQVVQMRGGIAVVQNPDDALYSGMPQSAVENVAVDHILPLSEIAPMLAALARELAETEDTPMPDNLEMEGDIIEMDEAAMLKIERPGVPSGFSCPACGGVLLELKDENMVRFRCRTGHAYSPGSLLAEQSDALEEALWTALRALEESAVLSFRLAERARSRGHLLAAGRFDEQGHEANARALIVRHAILKDAASPVTETENRNGTAATAGVRARATA